MPAKPGIVVLIHLLVKYKKILSIMKEASQLCKFKQFKMTECLILQGRSTLIHILYYILFLLFLGLKVNNCYQPIQEHLKVDITFVHDIAT